MNKKKTKIFIFYVTYHFEFIWLLFVIILIVVEFLEHVIRMSPYYSVEVHIFTIHPLTPVKAKVDICNKYDRNKDKHSFSDRLAMFQKWK